MERNTLDALAAHAQSYGFVYPSSEIYGGLRGIYDYGPHGVALKNNLKALWQRSLQLHAEVALLDAAILMHPTVWEASGHLAQFHDLFVDNKDSKRRYRLDHLIDEHCRVLSAAPAKAFMQATAVCLQRGDLAALRKVLEDGGVVCPQSKTKNWTPIRKMNLMFSTQAGSVVEEAETTFLRPETAQGIFVNFLNIQKSLRAKLPFGVAQVGKAFRNELILRQFLFRMREFEQMEMQFFVPPEQEEEWFNFWQEKRMRWYKALGFSSEHLTIHPHAQLAHYARKAVDIEYAFPFGVKEVEGIHARGAFDLTQHERHSKKKIRYHDPITQKGCIPHVVETSCGLDRLVLMTLSHALRKDSSAEKPRQYLALPPVLAPIKAGIFPLVKKDGLPEKARILHRALRYHFPVVYEEAGSVGKRYARQDLIGTPYCFTVDHETLQDDKVTIRERDSMQQERVSLGALRAYVERRTSIAEWLKRLV